MEINQQVIEKQTLGNPNSLEVVSIWKTIQGEGPYNGTPAAFVRMAGCNLQCSFCDTNYTKGRFTTTPEDVMEKISSLVWLNRIPKLVVITGGEPFRQDIKELVRIITNAGSIVQIETNGTLYPGDDFPFDRATIVCSPKTPEINRKLLPHINAWKYVVSHNKTSYSDGLPLSVLGDEIRVYRPPFGIMNEVFIQPMDEQDPDQNKLHLQEAVQVCLTFGYRLCLQMQKIAGVP